jgi:hypothetical protein
MTIVYGGKMAFPIHNTGHGAPFDEGMSLRDYIAIHAMVAFINAEEWQSTVGDVSKHVAFNAYAMADAMIEHRVSGEQ